MDALKTLKPRVWWMLKVLNEFGDRNKHSYSVCEHQGEAQTIAAQRYPKVTTVIKVHDSAYVRLLERIVERQSEALEKYASEENWEHFHVCDSYSGGVGCLFRLGLIDDSDKAGPEYAQDATTAVQQMCEEFKGG